MALSNLPNFLILHVIFKTYLDKSKFVNNVLSFFWSYLSFFGISIDLHIIIFWSAVRACASNSKFLSLPALSPGILLRWPVLSAVFLNGCFQAVPVADFLAWPRRFRLYLLLTFLPIVLGKDEKFVTVNNYSFNNFNWIFHFLYIYS